MSNAVAAPNGPKVAQKQTTPASPSLYISNLNDKINKDDLRRALYVLFSTHGTVLDVVALKTLKMRGQAHILFKDTQASTQAMRTLQGYELSGKKMEIAYAKGKSNMMARLDGTAKMPEPNAQPGAAAQAEVAKSIFNAPPGSNQAQPASTGLPNPPASAGLPNPPASAGLTNPPKSTLENGTASEAGTKRKRDESDVEAEDEEDEGAEMDVSDDE